MAKRDRTIVNKLLKDHQQCELCGSTINLEVHHIIPVMFQMGTVDLNVEDNMIVLCSRCHSALTPKSLLIRIGVAKNRNDKLIRFYEELEEYEGDISKTDILDIVDKHFAGI